MSPERARDWMSATNGGTEETAHSGMSSGGRDARASPPGALRYFKTPNLRVHRAEEGMDRNAEGIDLWSVN